MADGHVIIDTKINTKGIVDGTDKIIAAARRMAKQVDGLSSSVRASFSRQADSIQKAARVYQEQEEKVEGLRQKLEELENTKVKTQEYAELEKELGKLGEKFDKLAEKQQNFLQDGGSESSARYKRMDNELDRIDKKQDRIIAKMRDMESAGTAFISGADTEEVSSLQSRLAHEESRLAEMNRSLVTSYNALENKVEEYGNETKKASEETGKLGNAANKLGTSMGGSIKTLLKYSLGIRSLYALVGKLRSALVEGFKNLAQYSTNTNAALSGLMSSLAQCKNALATAFDPILQAIAPALNYLISLVTAAATAIAQLIAIITGKGAFIKATKVQKDYAKSLKATGGAAKGAGEDAEGALAPFDKLNVMAEDASGGGGGGGGGGAGIEDMFETVPVDNNLTKAIDAIKAKMAELRDLFKAGFFEGLGDLSVLDSIRDNIESIIGSLKDIFTDSDVLDAANRMMETLAYDMGRVVGSFASIGLSILDNITGGFALYLEDAKERIKQWLISMFDITSAISTIVANFIVALGEIFTILREEGSKQLTEAIIKMFSEAFMGVTELAAKFARDILDMLLTPFTNNVDKIKEAIRNTINPIKEVFETLADSVAETFEKMNQMYDEHLAPLFQSLRDGFEEIVGKLVDGYNQHIAPVLDRLAKKFTEVWKEHVQPAINQAIEVIGKIADVVRVFWEEVLQPFVLWIIENILPVIAPIIEGLGLAFEEKFGLMYDVVKELLTALEEILDFIVKVFQGDWDGAWNSIKESFDNSIDSFPEKAQDVVDRIQRAFDDLVTGVKESMKSLLSIDGVASPGILTKNLIKPRSSASVSMQSEPVHLPRLASGTVVPPRAGEFAAILGDNNRETEVVSPLSTMKRAMLEAMQQAGGMGGGDINLTVNLDGRVVYQNVIKRNRMEKSRTGMNPLMA